jgi:hypothetical protein
MKPSDFCSSFLGVVMTGAAALVGLVLVCKKKSAPVDGKESSDEEQWEELERKVDNISGKKVSWWAVGQ